MSLGSFAGLWEVLPATFPPSKLVESHFNIACHLSPKGLALHRMSPLHSQNCRVHRTRTPWRKVLWMCDSKETAHSSNEYSGFQPAVKM